MKHECGQEPKYHCPYCAYKSKRLGNLKTHLFNRHNDKLFPGSSTNQSFQCPTCPKTYKYKRNLYNHKKFECGKPPGFFCPFCEYKNNEIFPCPECNRVYRRKSSVKYHMRYECGKEPCFQCPFCSHRSKQKQNLKKHVCLKHPEHAARFTTMVRRT
ncbi:zinc finger protein 425-like [Cimex lectularius]|uniref:C2H2-type domain-containing protein n=1 Tax=Cimex lectularius TaxID=79782 RepID=A0A8I6SDR9_CIMLE|nr:zinc finger protein 425-like [Cimex lectularius]